MQISKTLAAAIAVAALSTIAGAPALASPSQDAGFTYRASPPSSNPHDVFRHNIKAPAPEAKTETAKTDLAMKACGCPMKAPASKSAHGG